jgi:hypothetical protein
MPKLTITISYVHSRVDSNTFTMGNLVPESTLTLYQSRLYPPVRDFGFGLRLKNVRVIWCSLLSLMHLDAHCVCDLQTCTNKRLKTRQFSDSVRPDLLFGVILKLSPRPGCGLDQLSWPHYAILTGSNNPLLGTKSGNLTL